MDNLSNTIYMYYREHFHDLPWDLQFHFASRLYHWSQDEAAKEFLAQLRPWFTADDTPRAALQEVYAEAVTNPYGKVNNALERRRPYFEKYPLLRTCNLLLFRITFLQQIYDIDVAAELFTFCERSEIEAMRTALLQDDQAIATLATYATNFLYLYDRVILRDESGLPVQSFYDIGASHYDLTDPADIQLYIYLYTHCIIGESKFYYRPVPAEYMSIYRTMITDLDRIISDRYDDINLDNKFEFLVAAKLVGYQPETRERIYNEASRSLAQDGDYLIDTCNNFPQPDRQNFIASEHRNVLFIMANRRFTPLQTEPSA